MTADATLEAHRAFLNSYYNWSEKIYDITRKYYLLGRDRAIDLLVAERWDRLIEVGPGTGRNLRVLQARRPLARLGGVEACDAMLRRARREVPSARIVRGFAETSDFATILDAPPERVLMSYVLSMLVHKERALDRALEGLAPGGELIVVDFGDCSGLPRLAGGALHAWLSWFHVKPLDADLLLQRGATITWGPGRYYLIARIPRPGIPSSHQTDQTPPT